MREEHDIPDGGLVREEHDEAVDPDALAGGRRHTVFQSAEKIFIQNLRFFIAPAAADYYDSKGINFNFHQLLRFLDQTASQRVHPVLGPRTVAQVLAEEQPRLLPLPYPLPQTDLLLATKADRQAFVRVDTNRYSVPVAYVDRPLTVRVDDKTVHVLCGDACIATHPRSYGKRQCLEQPAHRAAIVAQRRAAAHR
mgnify:CR=1 FL=1